MKIIIKITEVTDPDIADGNLCYECDLLANCYLKKIIRDDIIKGYVAFVSFCGWYKPLVDSRRIYFKHEPN